MAAAAEYAARWEGHDMSCPYDMLINGDTPRAADSGAGQQAGCLTLLTHDVITRIAVILFALNGQV